MVTKKKGIGTKETKKGRVKVGKLQLNKETVKGLTRGEQKGIKGGAAKEKCYMSINILTC